MGLFSDNPKKKNYTNKIAEYKEKIEQLDAVGMTASADRLRRELAKIDHDITEKIKPMSVAELNTQLKSVKATGGK